MEIVTSTYSSDMRNLIMYLLTNPTRLKTVNDLMPMIGKLKEKSSFQLPRLIWFVPHCRSAVLRPNRRGIDTQRRDWSWIGKRNRISKVVQALDEIVYGCGSGRIEWWFCLGWLWWSLYAQAVSWLCVSSGILFSKIKKCWIYRRFFPSDYGGWTTLARHGPRCVLLEQVGLRPQRKSLSDVSRWTKCVSGQLRRAPKLFGSIIHRMRSSPPNIIVSLQFGLKCFFRSWPRSLQLILSSSSTLTLNTRESKQQNEFLSIILHLKGGLWWRTYFKLLLTLCWPA